MMPRAFRAPATRILQEAHDRVYHIDDAALVKELAHALGRPTLARITNTPDLKTITRWSLGRNRPSADRLDRLRHAAMAYYALIHSGFSPTNAEQWFRGANPVLDFTMPVDALCDGRYADVLSAVESHAGNGTQRGRSNPMEGYLNFREFVAAVDARLVPYGIASVPEQEREREHAGWKVPQKYAWLFHYPEDVHYPAHLSFSDVGVEGIAIPVSPSPQQPYPLKLDDYGARTAAIAILEQFGIAFDPGAIQ
jgi:hypothetical protein